MQVHKNLCAHSGCTESPTFGSEGSKTTETEFCARHAAEGMVDVVSERYRSPDCNKHASLGMVGIKSSARVTPTLDW